MDPEDWTNPAPMFVTASQAAEIISARFFPVSARSLENWDVPRRVLNGHLCFKTEDIIRTAANHAAGKPLPLKRRAFRPGSP